MTQQATLPQPYKIKNVRQENTGNKTFILDGSLAALPGQFVMAWLPGMQDKPLSLANADPLSLTVAAVGPFSQALHALTPGDTIWLRGPMGQGYTLPQSAEGHLLLIGGGYGVAPLHYLAQTAITRGFEVSVIIGARQKSDLLLTDAFEALGVAVWLTTEDGSAGIKGVVTDAIPAILNSEASLPVITYACGPTGMLKAVAATCEPLEIPVQISWEAHMRCGIGLCGSCEVGQGWLTCLDGPVFPFDPEQTPPD
jgi:dihydroorotate dehydrogenase electron transfer subunit